MYGVDECRRCGVKIHPHGPEDRAQVEAFNAVKEEDAGGGMAEDGGACSAHSADAASAGHGGLSRLRPLILTQQKMQPFKRLAKAVAGFAVAFTIIIIIATYVVY